MVLPITAPLACLALFAAAATPGDTPATIPDSITGVIVDPPRVQLLGKTSRVAFLVHGRRPDGRLIDLTGLAEFRVADQAIARASAGGIVHPHSDGATELTAEVAGRSVAVPVEVSGMTAPRDWHFENDIIPLLSKFGCNTSGCHGKAEGQNGFKLSVFGFDPAADYASLTQEGRGRRIFPPAPERSLLIAKACGATPHGGGLRIPRGSVELELLSEWVAAGMPFGDPAAPQVASIEVTPGERQLDMRSRQRLRVVATYADGRQLDVTHLAKFQSNNEALATVDQEGLVSVGETPGEVAVMASYMSAVNLFQALIPSSEPVPAGTAYPEQNFIDGHVYRKLRKLNLVPSDVADDADYLRRVYLDVIGTLPTSAEARAFLSDRQPDRRARLVDELLARPEFADYWALKWADLLRVDRQALGHRGAYLYFRWIRESLAANQPYDQFVRALIAAEGPLADAPAGHFYKAVTKPGEMASTLSQVLLGVRIECAQCHHHPFDRWGQSDYFGMQAFFTQVSFKHTPAGEALVASAGSDTRHPRSGEIVRAHPLGTAAPAADPGGDRRKLLADWMTAPDNPWLARSLVNRVWAHFLGRGLIEPVDDVRLTNPATNPELLDALAQDFIQKKYDFRDLIRTIAASRVYQHSAHPHPANERDQQNYSRALFKRLDAEVLFDALCQVTGVTEKFDGVPTGARAIELWDSAVPHYFLKIFGRPVRATACECERNAEPSVAQVLHVLNSPEIHAKLTHAGGRIARLVREIPDDGRLAEELFLTVFSRFPTETERQAALAYFQGRARREAAEDLTWSMLNTTEFLLNH